MADYESTAEALAEPKKNLEASTAPTVTDDSSKGYSFGSSWVDQVTQFEYVLVDPTPGSADWRRAISIPLTPVPAPGDVLTWNGTVWTPVSGVPPSGHAISHEPGGGDAMTIDAAAIVASLRTLGTGALQACAGNDIRLSDSRAPTAHAISHEPGGGDAMAVDAAAGVGSLRTLGTGALQAVSGTDPRLSDARTPTAHSLGGAEHSADTLANLNIKVSDATLIDTGDSRLSDERTPLDDSATNAKLANMPANTIKGNNTGSLADPLDLTTAQATAMLDAFTSGLKGLTPASGGGTVNFLRADGSWAVPPSVALTSSAPVDVTKAAAVIGVGTTAARADHKHDITTAAPVSIGDANTEGAGTTLARASHVHRFARPSEAQGDILFFNGTNWARFPAGTDGQILVTKGVGANPVWESGQTAVPRYWSVPFSNQAGVPYVTVISSTYTTIAQIIWAGTSNIDALTKILIAIQLAGGTDADVRVRDITNALTICEVTGFTSTALTIQDMGTLSNLSTAAAVWEVQLLANGPGKSIQSSSFAGVF